MQTPPRTIKFYRETDKKWGCFSNFWETAKPILWQGALYPTSEHLYQTLKFFYEGANASTLAYAEIIRTAKTPNMAKLYARMELTHPRFGWQKPIAKRIAEFQGKAHARGDWEHCRLDMMLQVLRSKFRQDKLCCDALLSTEGSFLAEHTETDTFWADGGDRRHGSNHLGRLLMQVREELLVQLMESDPDDVFEFE